MGIQLIKYPRVSVFQVGHSEFHHHVQWNGGGGMVGMEARQNKTYRQLAH